ncbi:CYTH domain-containing protein [Micromonospora andamanensis]|uniref:CYTH domain-containing protein n=1 Tax=Micromonospora andamanensis TaxID=1287068 RepID=A0ABQ4I210_9ACTN|nr:CYTH domain-containing protein [Micromonospora andamanensis]GIJ11934.1 CYTH domain-containing protein [Micromonospora andamanensis]GIJ42169.1 CYTH domain-containing protein [Micromonospora andamanensis]
MPVETERKYLVASMDWRAEVTRSSRLRQGYLSTDLDRIVRVRLVDDETAFLTIKGRRRGDSRPEFEYQIPAEDAVQMLDHLCQRPLIEKERYFLDRSPGVWTVDVFSGDNDGLLLAEVEFDTGATPPTPPGWAGTDVTEDDRYTNSSLQESPFRSW